MSLSIAVENVRCGGCVSTIKSNLQQIPGVSGVKVAIPTGMVEVACDESLRPALVAKLAELGYPERSPGH